MVATVHVLVPAYDEAENLPRLFERLLPAMGRLERPWRMLVVDDGSTDGTAGRVRALAAGFPVSVVRHPRNLGPGAAFVTGFRTLLPGAADDDPVVTLEADGTSDLSILPVMLHRFREGADVVLASVYHPAGGVIHTPLYRRVLSHGANAVLRALFEMEGIHTFSSFYRVYRAGMLRRSMEVYGLRLIEEPGFASVVELLIRLERMGARIEEVPMVLDSARRRGRSHMEIGRTVRAYLRVMARERLSLAPVQPLVENAGDDR